MSPSNSWKEKTQLIRAGSVKSQFNEHSEALFLSSSFTCKSAQEAKALFTNEKKGYIYSRFTNPTIQSLAKRIAILENAQYGLVTASGMSAILTLCLGLTKAGDKVVCAMDVFGTSVGLFRDILTRFAVTVEFVKLTDYDAWEKSIDSKTKFVFCETPSNPLMECVDIQKLADICQYKNTLLIVDNCIATPALQKPLNFGCDIVIHSMTKFIDGSGRCLGGSIVTNDEEIYNSLYTTIRTTGPTISPFNAWVMLKSLETLDLRMKEHCENAKIISRWLSQQKKVKKVYHPHCEDYPHKKIIEKQMTNTGSIVSFEVKGNQEEAWKVIDSCQLFSRTANLGDTRSTICHPKTTTHHRMGDEIRQKLGISDELIRLSVGLEDSEDLCNDLKLD